MREPGRTAGSCRQDSGSVRLPDLLIYRASPHLWPAPVSHQKAIQVNWATQSINRWIRAPVFWPVVKYKERVGDDPAARMN